MAATPVEIQLSAGLAGLKLTLFPVAGGVQSNPTGGGDALTEDVNAVGKYAATVDEALVGDFVANVMDGANLVENGYVVGMTDTTTRRHVQKTYRRVSTPGAGAPPADATPDEMIAWLFKAWRNESDQSNGLWQLKADDGVTVEQKAVIVSSASLFTREEVVSGP